MDVAPPRHYVAGAMELILALLSLLSAATGALTGARAPEAGVVQAAQVGAIPAAATHAVAVAPVAIAAVAAPAALLSRATQTFSPRAAAARTIPLYADRLIE